MTNIHHDQAIAPMTKLLQVKVCVASEKSGISLSPKKYDRLVVLHPLVADVQSNLPHRYSMGFQKETLLLKDVFVQDNQALARSNTYSGAVY